LIPTPCSAAASDPYKVNSSRLTAAVDPVAGTVINYYRNRSERREPGA
jgi:hypothetical protein